MDAHCFKQAAITASCKIYCWYTKVTNWLLVWAKLKQPLQKLYLEVLHLHHSILAHCSIQFTWQSPCCCTRSSISHGQLSCFVFQAKLELRTSQNSVDCKITARPIELHCYTPRKQLISYLVCAKAVFAFLCQAQQNTIKPISSTLSQNVMNVGCRSKLCLIHQIKSITSWALRKSVEFCDYRLQGSLQ